MNRVLFSSATEHWSTPDGLYRALDAEFHFTLDPCPHGATDGSLRSWRGHRVYCNPPYGRTIADWLNKAREPELSVYLLPARTDTRWWHDHAMKADEIRFLRGRLKFGGARYNAPFPNVVLIYRNTP